MTPVSDGFDVRGGFHPSFARLLQSLVEVVQFPRGEHVFPSFILIALLMEQFDFGIGIEDEIVKAGVVVGIRVRVAEIIIIEDAHGGMFATIVEQTVVQVIGVEDLIVDFVLESEAHRSRSYLGLLFSQHLQGHEYELGSGLGS